MDIKFRSFLLNTPNSAVSWYQFRKCWFVLAYVGCGAAIQNPVEVRVGGHGGCCHVRWAQCSGFVIWIILHCLMCSVLPLLLLFLLFLLLMWSFTFSSTPFRPTSRDPVARFVTVHTMRLTAIMWVLVHLPVGLHSLVGQCNRFLVSFYAVLIFYSAFNFCGCILLR